MRLIGKFAPLAVLGASLGVWAILFVHHARRLWFVGDDFAFLFHRSVSFDGDHGLLEPHNEHWSTIPILAYRLNFEIFGLHHYLPYALLPIGCHILVCLLLFLLLRLSDVAPWVAVLAALVGAFTIGAAGAENTLWAFQVGFLGSCVFGLVALVLFAARVWGGMGKVIGVTFLVLSLMSSGMGLVMVVWSAAYLLVRDGVRAAVAAAAVPAVAYLGWFLAYGQEATSQSPTDTTAAPLVTMRGLAFIWSSATGIPHAGPVVLMALVAAVVIPRLDDRLFALAASGLVTVVVAYALLGFSRSGFGLDATLRSRYVYFGLVFTLPALAAGLEILSRALARRPARVAATAWLTLGVVVLSVGAAQASRRAATQHGVVKENRARLIAAADLVASGSTLLRTQAMPARNPDVDVPTLQRQSVREAIPDVDPGRRAELYVAANLQVDVGTVRHPFPAPADVRWRGFEPPNPKTADDPVQPGCETRATPGGGVVEARAADEDMAFRLTVAGTGIGTQLVSGDYVTPVVQWTTQAGVPVHVASTARGTTLRIQVPAGAVTFCAG